MIEQVLSVTTDLFEVTTPGEHFINPRCFGDDFAGWIRERLDSDGVETSEPIQEDWGWVLLAKYEQHTFTISIGVMDESIGMMPAEWRVSVAYEKPLNGFRSWFRPVPGNQLGSLFAQLRTVVSSEPRFRVSDTESL